MSLTLTGAGLHRPPAASGLMLDGITTGIKAAYSTRKLLTAYAGNAIQVQRISDNATQNIGFAAGVLDTASLATFCSGTTGKVITWYDQSVGANNITSAAIGNAPIIYQSGATNAINTKPALLFTNANSVYLLNASVSANPTNTLYQNAVLSANTGGTSNYVYGSDTSSAYGWFVTLSTGVIQLVKINSAAIGLSSPGISNATGAIVEVQYNSSTGTWSVWIDRGAAGTGTSAQTMTAGTTFIGAGPGPGNFFDGSIGELVTYDLVGGIPGASQTTIENNQKAYWGTP